MIIIDIGDDYDAIPAYEQIYALAGPIQTYRITGDPLILKDAQLTVDLFDRYFLDKERGGYFSHLDPYDLDPRADSLGENRAKKNWNSVGDHAPAYLINLYLATGEERYAKMLEDTFDTITEHFPNYEDTPFVQEKFLEDWSHDSTHMWQQNRGVVGHNLKIAWNLMRMYGLSANLMSLGGLAIAIGMLVDAAVVVVENVESQLAEAQDNLPTLHLIFRAASEVAAPVTSGIVIIIIVFLPLLTLQGLEGKLFIPVALTIIFALSGPLGSPSHLQDGAEQVQYQRLLAELLRGVCTRVRVLLCPLHAAVSSS